MEKVGEGEGGAEQGLGDLWDHLVVKEDRVINVGLIVVNAKMRGNDEHFLHR